MYRPNFCAECGERIERTRWRLWTSGRFCPACERRVGRPRLPLALAACAALIVSGFAVGRFVRPAPPPLVINRGQSLSTSAALVNLAPLSTATEKSNRSAAGAATDAPRYGADGTANERPTEPGEVVSICGARTKKGTPCSRRVRGTGRCWQHMGKPAILPPAKLIVQG